MGATRRAHGAAPAGKWTVRQGGYDPATGRGKVRQLGTFETKRAALELAKSVAVGRVGSADETVETFISEVRLKAKEGRVEQSTLDQYRWAVDRLIVPLIGAIRLRDLSAEIVDAWILDLSTAPEGLDGRGGSEVLGGDQRPPSLRAVPPHRRAGDLIDGVFE